MVVARTVVVLLALAAVAALTPAPVLAAPTIPVRVRIIKGSRQGPPAMDPKLVDLHVQLGALAYQRWDEAAEQRAVMEFNKPLTIPLPDGSKLELTLTDSRKETVTFDLKVPARKAPIRLTFSKDQRIVQQVTGEKDGAAFFATIRPWP
jgi:hypothetical protein